jgi:hypothetical protein
MDAVVAAAFRRFVSALIVPRVVTASAQTRLARRRAHHVMQ